MKFIVIGPTSLDITISLARKKMSAKTDLSLGGKGYNIAHALSVLGEKPTLYSMLGNDHVVSLIKERIQKTTIVARYEVFDARSSIFVGVNDADGNSLYDKIDVFLFAKQRLPKTYQASQNDVVVVTSSTNNVVFQKLSKMKKHSQRYILSITGAKSVPHCKPFLRFMDAIICNKRELLALGKLVGAGQAVVAILKTISKKYGVEVIIATDADKIINYTFREDARMRVGKKKVSKVLKPVSTYGAGDAFLGSFLILHYKHALDIPKSIQLASEYASYVVKQHSPTTTHIPAEIKKIIRS